MLTVFNILPVILLSLYPLQLPSQQPCSAHVHGYFRRLLSPPAKGLQVLCCLLSLHENLAAFNTDCCQECLIHNGFCLILLAHAVTFFKPYKHGVQNAVDTMFLLLLGITYLSTGALVYEFVFDPPLAVGGPYGISLCFPSAVLVLYIAGFVAMKLLPRSVLTSVQIVHFTSLQEGANTQHGRVLSSNSSPTK